MAVIIRVGRPVLLSVDVAASPVAAFAEFEHGIVVARTMDGLAAARSRGRVGGPKPKMTTTRAEARRLYDAGDKTVKEIADLFGASRPTVYRALEARIQTPAEQTSSATFAHSKLNFDGWS